MQKILIMLIFTFKCGVLLNALSKFDNDTMFACFFCFFFSTIGLQDISQIFMTTVG